MRHVFAVLGCIASLIMLAVSAAMNWQYGFSLGVTESQFNGYVLGAASIAADCLKALLPFFIFAAFRHRNWSQALGGSALWAVCILYALTSAVGFASQNRSDTAGTRAMQAAKYEDLRSELTRVQDQQKWLDKHRSVGMIESEIEAAKQNARWIPSEGCTNATITISREFCEHYHKLQAELAAAKKDEVLQKRGDEIRAELAGLNGRAAVKEADPQASMIAKIFGLDIKQVELGLTILITLLVELGSSMGLYVSTSTWRVHEILKRPTPAEPVRVVEIMEPVAYHQPLPQPRRETPQLALPRSDIEIFFGERIRQDDGASVTALALYDNYCEWCETTGRQPVGLPIFSRQLTDLGVQKAKIAGKIRYIGIRVTGSDMNDMDGDVAAVS